jgi:hypothetical protein
MDNFLTALLEYLSRVKANTRKFDDEPNYSDVVTQP